MVCGRELEPALSLDDEDLLADPAGGVLARIDGNHGTNAGLRHDAFSRSFLVVYLCDPCLVRKADEGRVQHVTRRRVAATTEITPFRPGG